MCTVTWWRDKDAGTYGVCFNRDERRTRPASEPVREGAADDGTAWLAPRDPAAGGTWLLANAHGLVVGVLNHYGVAADDAASFPTRSRGQLPLAFADIRFVDDVTERLRAIGLREFAPFIMVAWDRLQERVWTWDGAVLLMTPSPQPPVTTSSHRPAEVCGWRSARYEALVARPIAETLARYHDDVAHADPAFNVRMRRPDARTESVCRVRVTSREVRFWHRREAPDALAAMDEHEAVIAGLDGA